MNGWIIALIILSSILFPIILLSYRAYYRVHSKNKQSKKVSEDPLDNPDEMKRKEWFRHLVRMFTQKY